MIQPGLWREAGKSRKYVAFHVLCKWLALLCSIAVTFLFSVSFFRLFQREFSLTDFWRLGGVLLLLTFFRFLFLRMASRFSFVSAKAVKKALIGFHAL